MTIGVFAVTVSPLDTNGLEAKSPVQVTFTVNGSSLKSSSTPTTVLVMVRSARSRTLVKLSEPSNALVVVMVCVASSNSVHPGAGVSVTEHTVPGGKNGDSSQNALVLTVVSDTTSAKRIAPSAATHSIVNSNVPSTSAGEGLSPRFVSLLKLKTLVSFSTSTVIPSGPMVMVCAGE